MHAGCEVDVTDVSGNGPLALLEKYGFSHDVTGRYPFPLYNEFDNLIPRDTLITNI